MHKGTSHTLVPHFTKNFKVKPKKWSLVPTSTKAPVHITKLMIVRVSDIHMFVAIALPMEKISDIQK